jgi:hypothetical protein
MAETANLKLELERSSATLHRWYSKRMDTFRDSDQKYEHTLEESEATLRAICETNRQLELTRPINDSIKEQQRKDFENVKQTIFQNKQQLQALEAHLADLNIQEQDAVEGYKLTRLENDKLKQIMEQKLRDFTVGIQYYHKLGLEFNKSHGDHMKFSFAYIDPKQPLKLFCFVMYVDENNLYQLVETSPVMPSKECHGILEELNTTNNISKFIFQMRQLFVQSVQSNNV